MAERVYSLQGKRVFIAGETGLVGRSLLDQLQSIDCEILSAPHQTLDLCDQAATYRWLLNNKPDCIFMAAAKVGGIGANAAYPADFIRDNLAIVTNVVEGAYRAGVGRLLFLGSSCIYPRMALQPIAEEALLTGPLEPTNEPYAIAKIAGLKMVQSYRRQFGCRYIAAMPTNLYGPYDRFDSESGHVIPAMIAKFHRAKTEGAAEVILWGSGSPLREFLYARDLACALVMMMEQYDDDKALNIGSGEEISILDLADMIANVVGYCGDIRFDASKPDGTPRKLIDSSKLKALGWQAQTQLRDGLRLTYQWYLEKGGITIPAGRSCASSGT